MLKIYYNKKKERAEIYFSGPNFNNFYSIMKEKHFQFDVDGKFWTDKPFKILSVLSDLNDFEEIIYSPIDALQIIKNKKDEFTPETEFIRNSINISLLRIPPYKGKPPNENFQINCIKKGIQQNRLAFFLGIGTGKTFITINVLNHLFAWKVLDHVLIIAPSEGIYNWKVELLKFNSFGLKEEEIYIANAENRNPFDNEYKVAIMTYRTFLMISDDYYTRLTGKKVRQSKNAAKKSKSKHPYRRPPINFEGWGSDDTRAIILDESHKIKENSARQTYVIGLHKDYFKYRYLLSGTPTPNQFTNIYTQMKFLEPGLVPPTYSEFVSEVADIGNRFSAYAINFIYPEKQEEYEKRFAPWVVRIKTGEAIDLPGKMIRNIYAELPKSQLRIYQQLIDSILTTIKENNDGRLEVKEVFQKFPYMSMALDNPCLLKGKIDAINCSELYNSVEHFKFEDHGKLEIIESLLESYLEEEGRKIIVFDYHPLTIDQLAEHFSRYDPFVIHGQNTPDGRDKAEWRSEVIAEFKNSRNRNLMIANESVLTVAVNIQEATRAIYFSRNYSYTDFDQSQGRIYRIGSKEPVIVNPLIFLNSLDVRLDRALTDKQNLDNNIFKKKESMPLGDWRKIFKGEM